MSDSSARPPAGPPPGSPSGPPAGPPPGSPSGSPAAPASGSGGGNNRNVLIGVGVVVVIALIAGAFFFLSGDDDDDDDGELTLESGEVFLEPANDPGPDAFTEDIDVEPTAELTSQTIPNATTTTDGEGTTTTDGDGTTTTVAADPTGAIPSAVGSTPGLYGGTQDVARCDPAQLRAFLLENPDKASAWVAALNADPSFQWSGGGQLSTADIGAYIATLTPITLITDTRVTNNGYVNGQPTPRPAVLQAGTAVLVDEYGTPRAKCNCGNPLGAPTPVQGPTTYKGDTWTGFTPQTVVVVQPATVVIDILIIIDINTGDEFERPTGTTGGQDVPTGEVVSPPPTVSPSTTPPPSEPLDPGILTSTDFCEAIAEYDAIGSNLALDFEDEGSLQAWQEWAIAALTHLEQIAPDDIKPDVTTALEAVRSGDWFVEDDASYAAADERWYQWTLTNCGYDWYANDE